MSEVHIDLEPGKLRRYLDGICEELAAELPRICSEYLERPRPVPFATTERAYLTADLVLE